MTGKPSDDINKSVEDLINDIDSVAANSASPTNPASKALGLMTVIGKFACILAKLSRDAERRQRTMTRLTWAIFALTVVLLFVAAIQLWLMLHQVPASTH